MKLFEYVLAILIGIPVIPWLLTTIICGFIIRPMKKAKRVALEISAIYFFVAVDVYTNALFDVQIFLYMLLAVVAIGMGFTIMQWKIKQEVQIKSVLRSTLRVVFALSFIIYLILTIYGLTTYIITYIS